jgi:DNA polymerase delta subunit 1
VDTGDSKARAFEKSEDPVYVQEHGLPIDYQYYFMNKFLNPVCDLLEPLIENPKQDIFGDLLPQKKKPEPALSTMKKPDLIELCTQMGLDDTGTMVHLRDRIKAARSVTICDIFKRYNQSRDKNV